MGYHKTLKFKILFPLFIALIIPTIQSRHYSQPKPSKQNSNRRGFLAVHNAARAVVGVGPLRWNSTLASYAQGYSALRTADCAMEHSGGPYGENIAAASWALTSEEASKLWADEKANYDYASNACLGDGQCGHYTQMVWRGTARIGCAKATCRNGWTFVTCNYDPPGNYIGERPY